MQARGKDRSRSSLDPARATRGCGRAACHHNGMSTVAEEVMNHSEPKLPPGSQAGAQPCSLLRRGMIMLYDLMPALAVVLIAAFIALPVTGSEVQLGRDIGFTLYALAAWFAYLGLCWTLAGQTLGMRTWRVDLLTVAGKRPGWGQCLGRFAASLLSLACLGLGFWVSLFRSDRACWHDLLSGTRLIQRPKRQRRKRSDGTSQDEDDDGGERQ